MVTWKQVASGNRFPGQPWNIIHTQCSRKNKDVVFPGFENTGCGHSSSVGPDTCVSCSHSALLWHNSKLVDCDILRVASRYCPWSGEVKLCKDYLSLSLSVTAMATLQCSSQPPPPYSISMCLLSYLAPQYTWALKQFHFISAEGVLSFWEHNQLLVTGDVRHKLWDLQNEAIRTVSKSEKMGSGALIIQPNDLISCVTIIAQNPMFWWCLTKY